MYYDRVVEMIKQFTYSRQAEQLKQTVTVAKETPNYHGQNLIQEQKTKIDKQQTRMNEIVGSMRGQIVKGTGAVQHHKVCQTDAV